MKIMKMIYAIALATTLAATGCKHEPGKTTPLPEQKPAIVGDLGSNNTLPSPLPLNPDNNATSLPLPSADYTMWGDMIEDRTALANYTVHFAYDSAAVKSSEQSNLQAVAAALGTDTGAKLLIEGYCDERGTEEYNRSLGERRALATREILIRLGIEAGRLDTVTYGEDRPAELGHNEAAWSKNRRDEFVVLTPPKP